MFCYCSGNLITDSKLFLLYTIVYDFVVVVVCCRRCQFIRTPTILRTNRTEQKKNNTPSHVPHQNSDLSLSLSLVSRIVYATPRIEYCEMISFFRSEIAFYWPNDTTNLKL